MAPEHPQYCKHTWGLKRIRHKQCTLCTSAHKVQNFSGTPTSLYTRAPKVLNDFGTTPTVLQNIHTHTVQFKVAPAKSCGALPVLSVTTDATQPVTDALQVGCVGQEDKGGPTQPCPDCTRVSTGVLSAPVLLRIFLLHCRPRQNCCLNLTGALVRASPEQRQTL